ncbi:MAG: ComEC family competence protein [Chloroflexi bacterium]|nr:MAG: ComEC family competence protein [Chloroflexota bacterium]
MWACWHSNIHSSWLILTICLTFVSGVIAAQYVDQALFSSTTWLFVAIILAIIGFYFRSVSMLVCIVIAGCVGGLWRGSVDQVNLSVYQNITGNVAIVRGVVSEDVDSNQRGQKVVRLHDVLIDDHAVAGKIWVTIGTKADIKRSDILTVRGKVKDGFGNFSVTIYSATLQSIDRPYPGDVALRIRDWFADHIRLAISDPQAALGIGYLVGQRRALPPELDQALQIAGLTHVVVASGYNLTILVRLARRLFVRISKYASVMAASGMVVSFMAVTGMSPSMSRAGLVAGLSLLAWYYGRKFHPLVLLSFAAAVTVLINPGYAWGDLGWQLSFAAFGGVMILAPLGQAYFYGSKKPGTIRQILGETIAAQIATLPILVLAFSQFSNVAVIANALVLPLVPLAMLLTFIAGVVAIIAPAAATLLSLEFWRLLQLSRLMEFKTVAINQLRRAT